MMWESCIKGFLTFLGAAKGGKTAKTAKGGKGGAKIKMKPKSVSTCLLLIVIQVGALATLSHVENAT